MKKNLITLASIALVSLPLSVKANGFATVTVDGPTTTNVNDQISINVKLEDIKETLDGVVAFGGDLNYDKTYLEYIGSSKNDTSYEFAINEDILRIAGVDFTLKNGIKEDTTVYTFNFKVLKEGNTKVSFDNAEVVDKDASVIKHTNKDLDITINTQEETKEEEIVEEVKQEVKNDTKEIKKEIKETKEEVKEEKEETPIVEETKEEKTNVFKEIIKNIIDAIIKIFNRK